MTTTKPTTAFVGGNIWTPGYTGARGLDVLVRGDRIAEVTARGDLDTRGADVHDISGTILVPGFQDAHLHMATGGSDLRTCNLAGLTTPESIYDTISQYAADHPDLPWIIGGGWGREVFPYPEGPNRDVLDRLVGGRPAFISPFDRHGAWVSTAALRIAGLDDETPDPRGGRLRRDEEDGHLTGMLEEAAVALVADVMPAAGLKERTADLLKGQEYLHSLGITSVQDALVGTGLGMPDQHDAYCELLADGRLTLRLTTALWWEQTRGLEQIPEIQARRTALEQTAGPDRVVADTVKIMVDGADQLFMDATQIEEVTFELDRLGFSLHYHSYGDATTHWILDAIEEAVRRNGPRRRRHQIAHLFVVAAGDFPRFAQLGVTANIQGYWAGSPVPHDHMVQSTMTDDPGTREYPFGRLAAAGTRFAAGSDWPVTTPDPLVCTQAAAGLLTESGVRKEIGDLDRVDPLTMLTAYTTGSAFVNGREHSTGRIAPRYFADLAVITKDPLRDAETLAEAQVVETWVGGEQVH